MQLWLMIITDHNVIEKGFREEENMDFPILTVLIPISQETKVTEVTEYVF